MLIFRFANSLAPRAVRTTVVCASLLLAIVAIRPPEAHGVCGDYLAFGSLRHTVVDALRLGGLAPSVADPASDPSRLPERCNGIECAPDRLPPLAPTTLRMIERQELWVLGADDSPPPHGARSYFVVALQFPANEPTHIFRPPKLETTDRG